MRASNAGVEGTNRDRRDIAGYRSMTCWTCQQEVRRSTVQFITPTATHQWIYIYRSLQYARLRRILESSTVYAAVNLKQSLRLMYCTIEANDRHEASRGFFATADTCSSCLPSRVKYISFASQNTERISAKFE